jgi:NADH-quinone oxidoreductase subunit J
MLVQILALIGVRALSQAPLADNAAVGADVHNTVWLARTLFTEYLLPFEVAAVILTVAVIAAVMLVLRRREGVRQQDPTAQARVRASDRLRMVKMPAAARQDAATPDASADRAGGEGAA